MTDKALGLRELCASEAWQPGRGGGEFSNKDRPTTLEGTQARARLGRAVAPVWVTFSPFYVNQVASD